MVPLPLSQCPFLCVPRRQICFCLFARQRSEPRHVFFSLPPRSPCLNNKKNCVSTKWMITVAPNVELFLLSEKNGRRGRSRSWCVCEGGMMARASDPSNQCGRLSNFFCVNGELPLTECPDSDRFDDFSINKHQHHRLTHPAFFRASVYRSSGSYHSQAIKKLGLDAGMSDGRTHQLCITWRWNNSSSCIISTICVCIFHFAFCLKLWKNGSSSDWGVCNMFILFASSFIEA